MEKLGYSRQTQKLIYWIISDFANFWNGDKAGNTPTTYDLEYAKNILKSEFAKIYQGFNSNTNVYEYLNSMLEDKYNLSNDTMFDMILKAYQMLQTKSGYFSLSLNQLSQKQANDFVQWLIQLAIEYRIELRQEIINAIDQEEYHRAFIFACLKNKVCCVCGKNAELHHYDQASSIGGYKFDDGLKLRVMPLCREHHTEIHNIGRDVFSNKYHLAGIRLKVNEVAYLKKNVYKNHFEAFKE